MQTKGASQNKVVREGEGEALLSGSLGDTHFGYRASLFPMTHLLVPYCKKGCPADRAGPCKCHNAPLLCVESNFRKIKPDVQRSVSVLSVTLSSCKSIL